MLKFLFNSVESIVTPQPMNKKLDQYLPKEFCDFLAKLKEDLDKPNNALFHGTFETKDVHGNRVDVKVSYTRVNKETYSKNTKGTLAVDLVFGDTAKHEII